MGGAGGPSPAGPALARRYRAGTVGGPPPSRRRAGPLGRTTKQQPRPRTGHGHHSSRRSSAWSASGIMPQSGPGSQGQQAVLAAGHEDDLELQALGASPGPRAPAGFWPGASGRRCGAGHPGTRRRAGGVRASASAGSMASRSRAGWPAVTALDPARDQLAERGAETTDHLGPRPAEVAVTLGPTLSAPVNRSALIVGTPETAAEAVQNGGHYACASRCSTEGGSYEPTQPSC